MFSIAFRSRRRWCRVGWIGCRRRRTLLILLKLLLWLIKIVWKWKCAMRLVTVGRKNRGYSGKGMIMVWISVRTFWLYSYFIAADVEFMQTFHSNEWLSKNSKFWSIEISFAAVNNVCESIKIQRLIFQFRFDTYSSTTEWYSQQ